MRPDSGFTRRLCDAIWTDSGWVVLVYDVNEPGNWNRTVVYRGQNDIIASREIDSGHNRSLSQWFGCSINSSLTLAARDSGQFAAAWSDYSEAWMFGGWFGEFWVVGNVYSFCGNQIRSTGSVFEALDSLFLYNIDADSLLSLGNRWGYLSICSLLSESFAVPCIEQYTDTYPISFLPTRSGRYFILSQTDSARVVELSESAVTVLLTESGAPLASETSRGFGLSWISRLGEELYLYRVDTTGSAYLAPGQVYVPAGTMSVDAAHMAQAASGKLAMCWSERLTHDGPASLLRVASVGWNTALDAPDPSRILHPSSFNLSAYPNPFNGTTRIEFTVPVAGEVDVAVFNLSGQRVATLQSGRLTAGTYNVPWSPTGGSGVYFIRMAHAAGVRTLKTVYLK
jgi:hypothetical protein